MDFGKVANPDEVDLSFPDDHKETTQIIAKNHDEAASPLLSVGCAKWGRADWIGQFYPRGTKASKFLSFYAQNFNSVELNATFHRMPDAGQTRSWASQSGEGFLFFPKIHQSITHWQRLKGAERATHEFLVGIDGFADHLGTSFLQLPPNFSPKAFTALRDYLEAFPTEHYRLTVEFRHADWFGDRGTYDETFALLREQGVGAVITDTPGRRDVLHLRLTTPEAFIRFVGNNLHPTDYTRLDDWVERINEWIKTGLRRIAFFMHHPDELHSPTLITYFLQRLNERCGLSLHVPKLLNEEGPSLFG